MPLEVGIAKVKSSILDLTWIFFFFLFSIHSTWEHAGSLELEFSKPRRICFQCVKSENAKEILPLLFRVENLNFTCFLGNGRPNVRTWFSASAGVFQWFLQSKTMLLGRGK